MRARSEVREERIALANVVKSRICGRPLQKFNAIERPSKVTFFAPFANLDA